jgi:hypothetical protein
MLAGSLSMYRTIAASMAHLGTCAGQPAEILLGFPKTGHLKRWRLAMVQPDEDSFVHRSNPDGTTDSICKRCFVTVCTSMGEAKLAFEERKHVCDPDVLAQWERQSRTRAPTPYRMK